MKLSKVQQAAQRASETRRVILDAGARCIESVTDKCGIMVERFIIPGGESLILYGTPDWHDVYVSVDSGNPMLAEFHAKLKALINK